MKRAWPPRVNSINNFYPPSIPTLTKKAGARIAPGEVLEHIRMLIEMRADHFDMESYDYDNMLVLVSEAERAQSQGNLDGAMYHLWNTASYWCMKIGKLRSAIGHHSAREKNRKGGGTKEGAGRKPLPAPPDQRIWNEWDVGWTPGKRIKPYRATVARTLKTSVQAVTKAMALRGK